MPDDLNIVTAQLAGYFVTSVLYGVYLYTFFQCLFALLRSRSRWKEYSEIHWGLVVVTLVLFINGTFNISLGLVRLVQQFALHVCPVGWVNTVKLCTVYIQTMLGEGVMIFRCFHVWGRSWVVIIFPLALWSADLGIALWESWLIATTHIPLTNGPFTISASIFWGLTATMNIYSTGMIVYRIWNARDDARNSLASGRTTIISGKMTLLDSVIRIVIDSALGYTLVSLTLFFSQVARSNALYITSGAEIQAVGIAFNLINIRVANMRKRQEPFRISAYNGNDAVVPNDGFPIKFAAVPRPSSKHSSATDGHSSV